MSRKQYEARIYRRRQRGEIRRLINQEKLNRGACVDCGLKVTFTNYVAFDFDHLDRNTKIVGIADLVISGGREKAAAELAKCVLRCAICHRLKTYADRDYIAVNDVRLTDTSQLTLFEGTA